MPKGVMLTHRNFVSNCAGLTRFDGVFKIRDDDVYFSYLPLAHVFERCILLVAVVYKMQIGFYQGDVFKIKEDMAILRPTFMISVPRLYNRFYDLMQQGISQLTGFKKALAEKAVATKLENLEKNGELTHTFYDALVFKKFREILGGRVRVMITGSAPISREVLSFLKIAFCCQIHEGYGQTECAAPASITWSQDKLAGHVGAPFPSCDIKLVDVPDMNYTSDDKDEGGNPLPRGEVCYRGYNCFKGYYKQPELTKETIDSDGWIHTGDIGQFTPYGTLKIIDRKKNIFKLSQGEYVVPDKVESKIAQSLYIGQVFVYGDSLQSNLVAIIVPDKPVLDKWAADNQVTGDYKEILKNQKTRDLIKAEITQKCKAAGLHGFEIPSEFHVTDVAFTPENDILTPTFKLKRNEAKLYFLKEIKEMYKGAKLQGEK
jgi:long-chain acyl-CoA synthetase